MALGVLQPAFEGVQLFGADAACADANGGGLPRRVASVRCQVPLGGVAQLGKAALPLQVAAHGDHAGALRYHLAVQRDLGFEPYQVARQAGGQLAGLDGAAVCVGLNLAPDAVIL